MINKKSIAIVSLLTIFIGGCATSSTGNKSIQEENEATLEKKITIGETTKAEVRTMFGSPMSTNFADGNREVWAYYLSESKVDAVNYVPIVNRFGSSTTGKNKQLVIMFKDDVVEKYNMSETDMSNKSGVFNN
ncbi:outer membrane protein assembly factor BamE [Microbulbifer sp. TRSA002]|uniref:outer membrane protein assembly factor BamE domain-containing protein n=1 Tax=Microbulbifer sp. TRSA002 TaxID=3243382 RepID=UPI0040399B8B